MKRTNSIVSLKLTAILSFALMACGNSTTTNHTMTNDGNEHQMGQSSEKEMSGDAMMEMNQNQDVTQLIDDYLSLKDALVKDDTEEASKASQKLAASASAFDAGMMGASKQTEISSMLEVIQANSERISAGKIKEQRNHFERVSQDFAELLQMTGSDRTLYQQYCPMYDSNKGGVWLSDSKEIRNPLFGSSMLTCGSVTETFSLQQ